MKANKTSNTYDDDNIPEVDLPQNGTEDSVMNREKYSEYRSNLPDSFQELVIEGGCHSYFGMYGAQEGDGIPSVSNEEQIKLTADAIVSMMQK